MTQSRTNRESARLLPQVYRALKTPGVLARFVAKISVNDNGCWDWTAGTGAGGYGVFKIARGITMQSHRIAYILYKGDPTGLIVRHSCDRPLCCNPQHLSLGTHQDNMNDRWARHRATPHKGKAA